eukprot:CAMPEP_0176070208 /NCGR_PEP_ID=MMETSP0120_2-20121206/35058_1 /TAXON_ID=160619 /ORGANISM="Kryptoperidinium foliaceum, Strain CCMP 1326" /LENGTH=230 /DNA_ID=CAMNT_0017403849 /DNA_START=44 /DNA_END=736 /DNA_ORIENTATION=+
MKFSPATTVLAALGTTLTMSDAYTFGGGYACGPRANSAFRARMQQMTPKQQAELRRQQSEFVDRAFEALASDLQSSKMDPNFIPKQKELVNKAVEFFTDLGGVNRNDAESLRDITNKSFEMAQDIASGAYSPAYEVRNKDTEIEISLDLPGVSKDDIEILLEEGVLKISGSRNMGSEEEPKSVPFARSFPVGKDTVDGENISAKLENGVLFLQVPKIEPEKPVGKKIDIV